MNIADRIQTLRKTRGVSQEELADRIGVSRQAVSKWESEQSVPDLDNILLISEYFDITTDYLLKGIEPAAGGEGDGSRLTSRVLYVGSAAMMAIGLFCAFGGWHAEQTAESIWGSMIIQAVGAAGYFIGRLLSPAKAPLAIRWLNLLIAAFMPVSMLVEFCLHGMIAPYPTEPVSGLIFTAAYGAAAGLTLLLLKRRGK